MSRRIYGQYCGLATALDVVGERWTALLVRDLALSPRRFTDLLEALPGLGTSLLSQRLRHLEDFGLAERVAADRAAGGGVVYRLTGEGMLVARALAPLTVWGATRLGDPPDGEFRPEWLAFVLQSSFRPAEAEGVDDCYEFRLHGQTLWVEVRDGAVAVTQTKPRRPDFVATLPLRTLAAIGSGLLDPIDAVTSGEARFEGDPEAARRALRLLGSTTAGELPVGRARRARRSGGSGI